MDKNETIVIKMLIGVVLFIMFCGMIGSSSKEDEKTKCIKSSCDNYCADGSIYCYRHKANSSSGKYNSNSGSSSGNSSSYKPSGSSSSNSSNSSLSGSSGGSNNSSGSSNSSSKKPSSTSAYNSHNSYDDGYNAIYEDDDYDWGRYQEDDDYASGVDDAMEDAYDDFGDDW